MGIACEIVSGKVVNQTSLTAVTFATGDSGTVKAYNPASQAWLLNIWANQATAGTVRVRSPRLHDNVQNLRFGVTAATPQPLISDRARQMLYPQDVLIVEQAGGGAETDALSLLNWYGDLPGTAARLYQWADIASRVVDILSIECALTTGTTLGDYVGSQAINATFDLLEANRDYAILGYDTSAAVCSIGLRGPDTGNLRIGGPGSTQRLETRDWFAYQADVNNVPLIPVINAANKGATLVDVVQTTANSNPTIDFVAALLAP